MIDAAADTLRKVWHAGIDLAARAGDHQIQLAWSIGRQTRCRADPAGWGGQARAVHAPLYRHAGDFARPAISWNLTYVVRDLRSPGFAVASPRSDGNKALEDVGPRTQLEWIERYRAGRTVPVPLDNEGPRTIPVNARVRTDSRYLPQILE